jgi:hypothetical protein
LQAWVNANVGYSFAIVAALSFIFGLLIGRLSVGNEVRYVIPKELGPQVRSSVTHPIMLSTSERAVRRKLMRLLLLIIRQWNELLAKKKELEEKKQARREKREQRKGEKLTGENKSQDASTPTVRDSTPLPSMIFALSLTFLFFPSRRRSTRPLRARGGSAASPRSPKPKSRCVMAMANASSPVAMSRAKCITTVIYVPFSHT